MTQENFRAGAKAMTRDVFVIDGKQRIAIISSQMPGRNGVGTVSWNHALMLSNAGHEIFFITRLECLASLSERSGNIRCVGLKPVVSARSLCWSISARLPRFGGLYDIDPMDIDIAKFAKAVETNLSHIIKGNNIDAVLFIESFQEIIYWNAKGICKTIVGFSCPRYLFQKIGLSEMRVNKYLLKKDLRAVRAADAWHAPSIRMAELASNYYSIDRQRIKIIPNPIDIRLFHQNECESSSQSAKICFVGRFTYEKGADVVLSVMPRLMREHKNVFFTIVGESGIDSAGVPLVEILSGRLMADSTSDRFLWQKRVNQDDMPSFFMRQSILLSPSRFESFGMAVAEAQSCGIPAVVSDVGGMAEIVENNVTGILVRSDDNDGFYEAVKRLVENETMRREMGGAAASRAAASYSFTKVASLMEDVL